MHFDPHTHFDPSCLFNNFLVFLAIFIFGQYRSIYLFILFFQIFGQHIVSEGVKLFEKND